MKLRLSRFLRHWNRLAETRKREQDILWDEIVTHTRFAPRGNLYIEHDIGNKNIRYPDGVRSVKTRKVKDTAGTTFYAFADDTPLS